MGLFSRDSDDDADGENLSLLEQRGFVASAIVVGAIVICLVVYLFARGGDQPDAQPSPGPTTVAPTGQPPTTDPTGPPATPEPTGEPTRTPIGPPKLGVGGCKAKNPDKSIPRIAPAAVTWQFEGDMLIPLQQEAGPAAMSGSGVRSCFAPTPTGAVLASMVLLAQIRHPALAVEVLRDRVAPGRGRTAALAEARVSTTPRNQSQAPQFTGFKVYDYFANRAIISLAVKIDDRSVAAMPITMIWTGGDWKAVLQDDGSFNGQVQPDLLQSLDGYVRFGGA